MSSPLPDPPALKQRPSRRPILLAAGAALLLVGAVAAIGWLRWNGGQPRPTSDSADYPRLLAEIEAAYPGFTGHLPAAIPPGATDILLRQSMSGALQAEPYISLACTLSQNAAEQEVARLRSLGPTRETHKLDPPSYAYDPESHYGELLRDHPDAVELQFFGSESRVRASVWIDPAQGRFAYWLARD